MSAPIVLAIAALFFAKIDAIEAITMECVSNSLVQSAMNYIFRRTQSSISHEYTDAKQPLLSESTR